MPATTEDRRPAPGRAAPSVRRIAVALTQAGLTPNQVSLLGVFWSVAAGAAWLLLPTTEGFGRSALCLAAALFLGLRLLCNLLDGVMAIEGGQGSSTGEFFNELPERVSDVIVFVAAGVAAGHDAPSLALGLGAALVAVLAAYVRVFGVSLGQRADFSGPFAKPQRMAAMAAASVLAAGEPWLWSADRALDAGLWLCLAGTALTVARRVGRLYRRLSPR